jgi:tetratricopeptide (TPR) repeat protein
MVRPATGLSEARPFAGLRAFDIRDSKFFFGRSDQMAALYRLVDRNRFVAVIGSSGSGKSSLTRAGLFRILEQENQEGRSAPWVRCTLRPGDAPLASLTDALTRLLPDKGDAQTKRDRIEHLLTGSTFGCADAITEAGVEANARFVLVIDQFEELFRYSDQRQGPDAARNTRAYDQAQQFVELLLEASRSRGRAIHVLITMRSDFIGECAQFPGLAEAVSSTQFLVPGLTDDQLEEIIRRPIELANSTIEPDLVQQLMINSSKDLDELPVLQHCLLQLWKQAGRAAGDDSDTEADESDLQAAPAPRHITLAHYDQVGRLSGALSKHANRIMRGFGEADVAAVFRALSEIRNGRAIRRALPYGYLGEETGLKDEKLRPIIDRFRADDCSFLLTSPANVEEITDKTRIDICHEALLRRWEKCGGTAEVAAAHQTGPAIGWLEQERRDGQDYQFLLSKAENRKGWLVEDVRSHLKWWNARHPTERWAERYGGGYAAVQRMLRKGSRNLNILQSSLAVVALLGVGWIASSEYKTYSAEFEAKTSLDLASDVLTTTLDDLNHGRMQVAAALEVEKAMGKSIAKAVPADRINGKPVNKNIAALESELHYTAADILWDAGKAHEALARATHSQKLAAELSSSDPANVAWQGILCESTQRVGDASDLNQDYAGALAQFQSAQKIAGEIGDAAAKYRLCQIADYYHSRAGDMLLKLQRPAEALAEFEEALKIAQNKESGPNPAEAKGAIPRYTTKIGQALAAQGMTKEALPKFDQAIERQKDLTAGPDPDAALQSNLALSYFEKAKVLSKPGSWSEAVGLYRQAIEIHQHLVDKDGDRASMLSLLADDERGLVDAYQRPENVPTIADKPDQASQLADLKDLLTTVKSERDIREKLATIDPKNKTLAAERDRVQAELTEARAKYDKVKTQADASAEPETKN